MTKTLTAIQITIEVFIGRLRKKLGVDVLHTIRGMGYCVSEAG
jgi:two-component system OmpR family response regulator